MFFLTDFQGKKTKDYFMQRVIVNGLTEAVGGSSHSKVLPYAPKIKVTIC